GLVIPGCRLLRREQEGGRIPWAPRRDHLPSSRGPLEVGRGDMSARGGVAPAQTANKLDRLRQIMQSHGLDGVVLSSYQNVSYFGGTTVITQVVVPDRLGFLVARRDGAVSLLFCNIETSQVRTQT